MNKLIILLSVFGLLYGCGNNVRTEFKTIKGERGEAGKDGSSGSNGLNSLIKLTRLSGTVDFELCDSESGVLVQAGTDLNSNGELELNEITAGQIICDGEDGNDGEPASEGDYNIVGIVDLCGDGPGFDEVLLRLSNGMLLAHFSSGSLQFLSSIGPGSYVTTDGQACYFTVTSDLEVVW